jgi:hypothetical protein
MSSLIQPPTESNVPEQNEEPMQWEQQQQKGQEQENETDFIRLQLGTILGDRRANLMGAEQKLRFSFAFAFFYQNENA